MLDIGKIAKEIHKQWPDISHMAVYEDNQSPNPMCVAFGQDHKKAVDTLRLKSPGHCTIFYLDAADNPYMVYPIASPYQLGRL